MHYTDSRKRVQIVLIILTLLVLIGFIVSRLDDEGTQGTIMVNIERSETMKEKQGHRLPESRPYECINIEEKEECVRMTHAKEER